MSALLEVRDLHVAYGKVEAVHGVSLAIDAGRIVTVIGPNGAGKTTLLGAIMGLLPARGEIRYAGRRIDANIANQAARRNMQMIFQDPYASLNPRWRVVDIVAEPLRAGRGDERGPAIEARVATVPHDAQERNASHSVHPRRARAVVGARGTRLAQPLRRGTHLGRGDHS